MMGNVMYAIIYLTLIQPSTSSSEVEPQERVYAEKAECYPYPSMCDVDPVDCIQNRKSADLQYDEDSQLIYDV